MFIHFHKKSFQQTGQTVIHQHSPTSNLKRVKLDPKNITKSHLSQIKKKNQNKHCRNRRFNRNIP